MLIRAPVPHCAQRTNVFGLSTIISAEPNHEVANCSGHYPLTIAQKQLRTSYFVVMDSKWVLTRYAGKISFCRISHRKRQTRTQTGVMWSLTLKHLRSEAIFIRPSTAYISAVSWEDKCKLSIKRQRNCHQRSTRPLEWFGTFTRMAYRRIPQKARRWEPGFRKRPWQSWKGLTKRRLARVCEYRTHLNIEDIGVITFSRDKQMNTTVRTTKWNWNKTVSKLFQNCFRSQASNAPQQRIRRFD